MIWLFFLCILGFLLLYFGAESLVKGSSSLAASLGVTPMVIGLTVVAFGTSMPELVVSLVSAVQGKSMIAIGNVVGSNICNIALILGLSALFQPLTCNSSVMRRDIPIMLGVSLLLLFFSLNSMISRLEGMILFAGVVAYTFFSYFLAKREVLTPLGGTLSELDLNGIATAGLSSRTKQILMILVGIFGVVAGAKISVDAAVKIMATLGVSEKLIGLTIVAVGTSLPELATSVVAAAKKEMDISIGNLVGSNIFNLLCVIGISASIHPIPISGGFVESGLIVDYGVMLAISFLPWLMMRKSLKIDRKGGAFLLVVYITYMVYLIAKG
ncbi:MAG: calcium/sodium antiporter [Proteobacteria bacterium]|nr:calcium/sodium antiporter [Pseudomonadota bacterium]MBU4470000.1 calcium/sodium antiporter [Pseudomonadota bacterium]MCG2753781.1 calcium/sodium antiporter [Desulfobacteraceae bacterium]